MDHHEFKGWFWDTPILENPLLGRNSHRPWASSWNLGWSHLATWLPDATWLTSTIRQLIAKKHKNPANLLWLMVDLPLWKIWVSNSWDDCSQYIPVVGLYPMKITIHITINHYGNHMTIHNPVMFQTTKQQPIYWLVHWNAIDPAAIWSVDRSGRCWTLVMVKNSAEKKPTICWFNAFQWAKKHMLFKYIDVTPQNLW